MEAQLADLRQSVEAETTEEGLDLWRAMVHDGYGNLVACSKWTTNPARAARLSIELLDQARSDKAYQLARYEAHRLFTPAA